jgi:hypothetical protein
VTLTDSCFTSLRSCHQLVPVPVPVPVREPVQDWVQVQVQVQESVPV